MKSFLFIVAFVSVTTAGPNDFELAAYTDAPDFNNAPGYSIRNPGNGYPDAEYANFPRCAENVNQADLFFFGTPKLVPGYDCATETDKAFDQRMDARCEELYGENVRAMRGEEANAFFFGEINLINKNLGFGADLQVFTKFDIDPPHGFAPACDENGDYCGGSCGRYSDDPDTNGGRRVCGNIYRQVAGSRYKCWEHPFNLFWEPYNPAGDKYFLAPDGSPSGAGSKLCALQRKAETNLVRPVCVGCGPGRTVDEPMGLPCKIMVRGGTPFPITVGILPGATCLEIGNAQFGTCFFDGVAVDDCTYEFNPGDTDGKLTLVFTPLTDGSALIHQCIPCDSNTPLPLGDVDETTFVVKDFDPNVDGCVDGAACDVELAITGCNPGTIVFRDPTTGTVLGSGSATYSGPTGLSPTDNAPAIAVQCEITGANLDVQCNECAFCGDR